MADDGTLKKPAKDFTAQCDALLPETESIAKKGDLRDAIDKLALLEKQTRTSGDLASTSRILVHIVNLCASTGQWDTLGEQVVVLSKKHGQLKQAITRMVQEAMTYLDKAPDASTRLALINTLVSVTEGKIFVEVERARLTRLLAKDKEETGDVAGASDILQELQVETFGSMERREKTDFLLEQVRLCIAKEDYTKAQIISKKINIRYFKESNTSDLKLRYYDLMIQYAMHSESFLEVCRYYWEVYNTEEVKKDEEKLKEVLQNMVIFVVLAKHDNEQSDLLHRIFLDSNLRHLPRYKELIRSFTTVEIMRWPKVREVYGPTLRGTPVFTVESPGGMKRWGELQKRVVEHNLRVVARFYTRIQISRLSQLLDLEADEAEETLCRLVVDGSIWARVDRLTGIITFQKKQDATELLNQWSGDIDSLISKVETVTHLINKEEMVHRISTYV
ncbi:hypothetical protein BJ684DRAFT_7951 [Piptocephalis cylindrospora]|uniref:PCI domain-containing protein n=1 Tax=Piptocephalis cylindrospora TaxID=1907219 RepID=A0A4P9Y6U2_9FUNG|nr:hypothetical protein BJ684DRAFT_7951 [Piptocephalis cylindrospora]|eukprot:RKP14836.1 hypothetical protein BJ684DRAFT_7951 [Piptocephalis cylindrospora]